jgi:hypothetical protein
MGIGLCDKMGMGIRSNRNRNESHGEWKVIPITHFVFDNQCS